MENALIINPVEYGIEKTKANELLGNLPQIKAERDLLEEQYNKVILMDIEDPATSEEAKKVRLLIRDNRTKGINVWHSTTKELFLRGGQFVDAVKRKENSVNERMENTLESIEKHFENLEKERKAKLNAERVAILEPFNAFVPMGLNFGEISEDEFTKILNGAKLQFEQQQKEEEEAEAERLRIEEIQKLHKNRKESLLYVWAFVDEKEINFGEITDEAFDSIKEVAESKKSDFETEQEEIRLENERLKALEIQRISKLEETAEKHIKTIIKAGFKVSNNDAYIDKIQHRYEKGNYSVSVGNLQNMTDEEVLTAIENVNTWIKEQSDKEKLEAELKVKKDSEAKAEKERLAEIDRKAKEDAKLAKAPIKKQLNSWVNTFEIPSTNIENDKVELIKAKFEAFKRWSLSEIELM